MKCIRCGADTSKDVYRIPIYHHVTESSSYADNIGDFCPKCFAHLKRDVLGGQSIADLTDTAVSVMGNGSATEAQKSEIKKMLFRVISHK